MNYYRTCPYCGAHLDPGERCDCQEAREAKALMGELKNIPASAANTDRDGVEAL